MGTASCLSPLTSTMGRGQTGDKAVAILLLHARELGLFNCERRDRDSLLFVGYVWVEKREELNQIIIGGTFRGTVRKRVHSHLHVGEPKILSGGRKTRGDLSG